MADGLGSTGDQWADDVNLPSIFALTSGRDDAFVVERLVALLRSDVPLHPLLRSQLADCLDKSHPELRLQLKRHKRGPRPTEFKAQRSIRLSLNALSIGRFIAEHPDRHVRLENAVEAAMEHFAVERSEAFKAWASWRAAEAELAVQGIPTKL